MRYLLKIWFGFFLIINYIPQINADSFSDAYLAIDSALWSAKINGLIDPNTKSTLSANISILVQNPSTLADWQKTRIRSLISTIQASTLFLDSEKSAISLLVASVIGSSTSKTIATSSYRPISTRLNEIAIKVNQVKNAADVTAIVTSLNNLLPEYYGSEKDRGVFSMILNNLIGRVKFYSVPLAPVTEIQAKIQNVSFTDKISFLERINDLNNFVDPAEKALFLNLINNLRENLSKLDAAAISRFHVTLTTAYSRTNFTDDEKATIMAIANEAVDVYNSISPTTEVLSEDQDNFSTLLIKLNNNYTSMNNLYKQGDSTTALGKKAAEFYLPLTNLQTNYLGDMFSLPYLSLPSLTNADKTTLVLPTLKNGINNEQQIALDLLDSVIAGSKLFTNDSRKISDFRKNFSAQISPEVKIKYLEDSNASQALSLENKKRYLYHFLYLISGITANDPLRIITYDQNIRIKNLLTVLVKDPAFNEFKDILNAIIALQQSSAQSIVAPQGVDPSSSIVPGAATISSNQNLLASLPNGSKISFYLGKSDSFSQRYIGVKKNGDNYSIQALQTNNLDLAAQFIIILQPGNSQIILESVKYPGMVLAYAPEKISFSEDLGLVQKPSNGVYLNQHMFSIVQSAALAGKICLVNAACNGYLSVMSDGTCLVTNFSQGNPELQSSQFSSYILNQNIAPLITLFSSNLNVSDKFLAITNYFKTLSNIDIVPIAIRETYNWIISLHKNIIDWQTASVSGFNQKLSNYFVTLLAGTTTKKLYQPFNNLITVLRSALEFSPDFGFLMMPNDREIFWLTEPNFNFKANSKLGFSVAFKTNGILNIYLSKSVLLDEKKYQIKIGSYDDAGNRVARLIKDSQIVAEAVCKDFDKDNFMEYQVIFDSGNISLYSTSGQILNYQNDGDLLIDSTSATETIVLGVGAESDLVTFDKISAGLELQYLYTVKQISEEPYSASVERINKNLLAERSVSDSFLKSLNEIIELSKNPKKLYGTIANWESLKKTLLSLKTQVFVSRNYTANSNIDLALRKFSEPLVRDQQKGFVLNLIEVLSFYHAYPSKQDQIELLIQSIVNENLLRLIKLSFSDAEKEEVSLIINGKISTEGLLDGVLIGALQNALAGQERLNIAVDLAINNKIDLFLDFALKLKTIDQRTSLLASINQTILEVINTSIDSRASLTTSIKKFQDGLKTMSDSAFFKDILGTISYFNFSLQNFITIEEQVNNSFSQFLSGSMLGDKFLLDLSSLITNFAGMLNLGLDSFHGEIATKILSKLSLIRQHPKIGQFVNKIDFLIGYIQVKGKLINLVEGLRKNLLNIKKLLDRDAFLAQVEAGLINYIESQIQSGNVNEDDRTLSKSFLTELRNNQWFRDSSGINKLQDLTKRLDGQTNPLVGLSGLTTLWSTLEGNDSAGFERFLIKLSDLSTNFKNYITNGGSVSSSDIATFNNFIDLLNTSSANETAAANSSVSASYLLYLKRFQTQPNYDLLSLKLDASGDIDLLSSMNALINQLNTVNFSVLANRQKLMTDFNSLVDKWKLFVVFDPSKLNILGTSLKKFYDLAANFFDLASKNILLIPNISTFNDVRQDMLEDQFTSLEKVGVFKNFLLSPGIGTKTAQQIIDTLKNIVNDFKNYQKLNIAMLDSEINQVLELLDLAKNKTELLPFSTKIIDLKTLVQTSPDMKARVEFINSQLTLSLNNFSTLSDIQKDNLVSVCSTIHNVLKALSPDALKLIDLSTFQQLITNLLSKNIFIDPSKTTLQNIRDSVITLIRSLSATPTIVGASVQSGSVNPTILASPEFQSYSPQLNPQQSLSPQGATSPQVVQQPAPGYRVRSRQMDYGNYNATPSRNPYASVSY